MKRQFDLSLLIVATLLLATAAVAAPVSPTALRYRGYVNDFADVIEPEWEQRLTRLITQLDQKTKVQVAVVTIRSLEGEPIEDFATKLFEVWGIGHKDDRGALLLLAIQDRKSRLEVGYGLEPVVPDGYAGNVLREMRPALRQQKYGEAIYAGVWLLAQRVAQASGVTLEASGLPRAGAVPPTAPAPAWVKLFVLLFFFGFAGLVMFFIIMSVRRPGYWHRASGYDRVSRWTSYSRSSGSGGFGGYDSGSSGGGFGGFGGGRSGGGGASSSW